MGNSYLNAGVPWVSNNDSAFCFIYREREDNVGHFLLESEAFRDNFESIWSNLRKNIIYTNPTEGGQISDYQQLRPSAETVWQNLAAIYV